MITKLVNFAATTAAVGNTQAITGVGFKPQAIIFFSAGIASGSTTVARATEMTGIGVVGEDLAQFSATSLCADAVDPTNAASFITCRTTRSAISLFNSGSGH